MKKFNKIIMVLGSIVLACLLFACLSQHNKINQLQHQDTVQADKVQNKRLQVGTRYKIDGLSMIVSEYTVKGHKNIIITTNLKHKNYYQVGSNDDSQHRTTGITVAFGDDQK